MLSDGHRDSWPHWVSNKTINICELVEIRKYPNLRTLDYPPKSRLSRTKLQIEREVSQIWFKYLKHLATARKRGRVPTETLGPATGGKKRGNFRGGGVPEWSGHQVTIKRIHEYQVEKINMKHSHCRQDTTGPGHQMDEFHKCASLKTNTWGMVGTEWERSIQDTDTCSVLNWKIFWPRELQKRKVFEEGRNPNESLKWAGGYRSNKNE